MCCDLLLKGGILLDPIAGVEAKRDLAFSNGVVSAVGEDLSSSGAKEVVNCSGNYVSPGLIDLHVHVYQHVSHYGVDPDRCLLNYGVSTAVDAGSAGAATYSGFLEYVVKPSSTRLFSFLNISSIGLLDSNVGELQELRYADINKAVKIIEENRETIKGVKVRLSRKYVNPLEGLKPLFLAVEAADITDLPVMVHPQDAPCDTIDHILTALRPGDILTHCFHGGTCGILNRDGTIRKAVLKAVKEGVIFDVGHGRGSFVWEIAEQALAQGFSPQTISSDLHRYNLNGPVYSLLVTASKFLYLGLPLSEVIKKVTNNPAIVLGEQGHIGTLTPGAAGDALIFSIENGSFNFQDSKGSIRVGNQSICRKTIVHSGVIQNRSV